MKSLTDKEIEDAISLQVNAKAGRLNFKDIMPRSRFAKWVFALAGKLKVWQHEKTGNKTASPIKPCPGWHEIGLVIAKRG